MRIRRIIISNPNWDLGHKVNLFALTRQSDNTICISSGDVLAQMPLLSRGLSDALYLTWKLLQQGHFMNECQQFARMAENSPRFAAMSSMISKT